MPIGTIILDEKNNKKLTVAPVLGGVFVEASLSGVILTLDEAVRVRRELDAAIMAMRRERAGEKLNG